MKAVITGENDERVGVNLLDNNDTEHVIEMEFDGEIKYHEQDGYPDDPQKRTEEGNEHINQTRRYAKYYVFKNREYDTVEHVETPEFVDSVRQVLAALSPSEFERYVGALYRQLRSHEDPSVDRLVDIPAGARSEDAVVYELDVYLGAEPTDDERRGTFEVFAFTSGLDVEAGTTPRSPDSVSESELDEWVGLAESVFEDDDPEAFDATIAAVSGIHVGYPDRHGEHRVERNDDPLDRQPDATIELMPYAPDSLSEFQSYLDHHLRCQVRDCYVGMGLLPPEPFRVTGFGKFIYARRYDHYDLYPPFHTASSEEVNSFF